MGPQWTSVSFAPFPVLLPHFCVHSVIFASNVFLFEQDSVNTVHETQGRERKIHQARYSAAFTTSWSSSWKRTRWRFTRLHSPTSWWQAEEKRPDTHSFRWGRRGRRQRGCILRKQKEWVEVNAKREGHFHCLHDRTGRHSMEQTGAVHDVASTSTSYCSITS